MNSNLINSTTPLSGTSPRDASELADLSRLDSALMAVTELLTAGKAEALPERSQEAASIARALSALYAQSPLPGALPEDVGRRKLLLLELRRKQMLCAALLRRWRRMQALRREVLRITGEPATYTAAGPASTELR